MKIFWISIFASFFFVAAAAAQNSAAPTSPASGAKTQQQAPESQTSATPSAPPSAQAGTKPSQAPGSNSATSGAPTRIAPGSVIPVSLTKTIDAKKAKTGEEVVATVTQDMKTSSGEVLLPKDTKVMGHVTEAQARNKEQKESQLGIAFDKAVTKDGTEMQMPMSIQAVIGQEQNNQPSGGGGGYAGDTGPGGSPATTSGARGSMGGGSPAQSQSAAPSGSDIPSDAQQGKNARPQITGQTQGVVGISNLTLAPAATNSPQGSLLSSEKNNVKLESGTMMLLRVNQ
jgi:hypothetical protein